MRIAKSPKIKMVSKALADRIDKQRNQYKAERDTLIDDIAILRANNSRLERENAQLKQENEELENDNRFWCNETFEKCSDIGQLEQENETLKHEHYKFCRLKNHIRQKAEANPNVDRYIALVNYIDRLEKGEN